MAAIDIAKQQETLARLRDELSRLNVQFDEQKKAAGLPEGDVTMDPSEVTPQLAAALETVKVEAEKAGRNAAASLAAETAPETAAPRRARRGLAI